MSEGLRYLAGASVGGGSLIGIRLLQSSYGNLPYVDVVLLVLLAVVPVAICRTPLLSVASSMTGATFGIVVWLLVIPLDPNFWPYDSISRAVGLVPLLTSTLTIISASASSGLIGLLISRPRRAAERPEVAPEVEAAAQPSAEVKVEAQEAEVPSEESVAVQTGEAETGREEVEFTSQRIEEILAKGEEEIYLICKFCSEPAPGGAKFCPHCGRKI
ncbi:MAG: zinc ribbon domain-containing protein [Aigarchaeota archaeon]|nr:zinc ribbon domain-containing protein [Aigarchaeota archaeon]MDW8093194.1 zinc ribbon domain-containing protein [Nitrososphaerota archaeon]